MLDLNAAVAETLKYGFPGVVIVVLAWVIWNIRKESRDDLAALQAKYDLLAEKRIAEGRESLNALNNTTNILDDVLKTLQIKSDNRPTL